MNWFLKIATKFRIPASETQDKQPWEMTKEEFADQGWPRDNWASVVRRNLNRGKTIPPAVKSELDDYDAMSNANRMQFRTHEKAKIGDTIVRYTHRDGSGLLNQNSIDYSKLTDNEASELPELLDYGLQQPAYGTYGTFYFTAIGEERHKKLIALLAKASKLGVIRTESLLKTTPNWESSDGQIAVSEAQA